MALLRTYGANLCIFVTLLPGHIFPSKKFTLGWVPARTLNLTKVNSFHKMFNVNIALFSPLKESDHLNDNLIEPR